MTESAFIGWFGRDCPEQASRIGWISFQLGLLFLPSSALLAGVFLLVSLVLGCLGRRKLYWSDAWNRPLLIAAALMLLGCFRAYSGGLAWLGLANWLPFFVGFWAFQPYLGTLSSRRRCALWFISGTVPVVITGLGQLWFGWQGPWQLGGGMIVWFMAPGGQPQGRLSGLFDYANIAGAWLVCVWPFALAAFFQPGLSRCRRLLALAVASGLVIAVVLTNSRNAWGALMLAVPFVLGPMQWFWLLPLIALVLLPVFLAVLPGIPTVPQQWARALLPESFWMRITDLEFAQERGLQHTRLSQWQFALKLVVAKPWLGWGAAAFSVLYPIYIGKNWHGHTHNLPMELAISHGVPVALLVVGMVLGLLITAVRRGVLQPYEDRSGVFVISIFDRAWWTATFILIVLHGTDLPFFDSRLNIAGWILLAGLRCIIRPQPKFNAAELMLGHGDSTVASD